MPTLDQLRGDVRAKVVGFLFFVGVLADVFGVTDRLDSAIPVVAAFVPLTALLGTLLFGVLLAERIRWWVRDRRNNGPARRKLLSLHDTIQEARDKLESSMTGRILGHESNERYQGRVEEVDALIESLAYELKQLGISTPPVGDIHLSDKVNMWLVALPRFVAFSSRGDLDAAVRLGEHW